MLEYVISGMLKEISGFSISDPLFQVTQQGLIRPQLVLCCDKIFAIFFGTADSY